MKNKELVFNRVQGLKFLYENFPYLYDNDRIKLLFVSSKEELMNLHFDSHLFNTFVLKRSANKAFISDIKFKYNRFFDSLENLKKGSEEFDDIFDFCVECHKFKKGENYYSDRLAIAQFSTKIITDNFDRVNFIPSKVDGVNTRDNEPFLEIEYPYNFENIYNIKKLNQNLLKINNFDNASIAYLVPKIHSIIETLKDYLLELKCYDDFQLIIRIDSNLNLLPIDFRTPEAWTKIV